MSLAKEEQNENKVLIKLPRFKKANTTLGGNYGSNRKCIIKSGETTLWEGYSGENARLDIQEETPIDVIICGGVAKGNKLLMLLFSCLFGLIGLGGLIFSIYAIITGNIFYHYVPWMALSISLFLLLLMTALLFLAKKMKETDIKICSSSILPGARYEIILVERNTFSPSKWIWKLNEVDIIASRERL